MKFAPIELLREGHTEVGICQKCRRSRELRYQYRTLLLSKSKLQVKDVLVGVCTACDTIVLIPHQSTPKLKEIRESAITRVDVRISKELRDVIGLLADAFGANPETFGSAMLRYYMKLMGEDPTLARRVSRFAKSEHVAGTPGGRIALRLSEALMQNAMYSPGPTRAIADRSSLIRGIILAAKEDTFDKPVAKRAEALRAIALAMA